MALPEPFKYQPLPNDGKSLRLVQVLPSTGAGKAVRIEVIHATTNDEYTALSYTWGPIESQRDVQVNNALLTAGSNLWEFLKRVSLSPGYMSKSFWIDAICINQKDDKEKSIQVGRMGEIYKSAQHVLIWLAPYRNVGHSLEDSIGPICDFNDVASCLPKEDRLQFGDDASPYESCATFIFVRTVCEQIVSHDYWRRLWIVQEFLLNERRSVLFGPLAISWKALLAYEGFRIATSRERRHKIWQNSLIDWLRSPYDMITFAMSRLDSLAEYIRMVRTDAAAHHGVVLPPHSSAYTSSSLSRTFFRWIDRLVPSFLVKIVSWRMDSLYACLPYMEGTFRSHGSDDRPIQVNSKSAFYLIVQGFAEQLCFDRKDKLYGLSALISGPHSVPIDYSIDVLELYHRALGFFLDIDNTDNEHCFLAPDLVACGLLDVFKIGLFQLNSQDFKKRGRNFFLSSATATEMSGETSTTTIKSKFMTFEHCIRLQADSEQRLSVPCEHCGIDLIFSATALLKILELQKASARFGNEEVQHELVLVLQCLLSQPHIADTAPPPSGSYQNMLSKHLLFYSDPSSGRPEAILSIQDEAHRQRIVQDMPADELKDALAFLGTAGQSHSATHTFAADQQS